VSRSIATCTPRRWDRTGGHTAELLKILARFVVALLAAPVAVAVTAAFYKNIKLVNELALNLNFFLFGMLAYVVLHLLFYKPTFLYVFGHEAVHAGMSWLFGGKIKSFKASKDGGAVTTDKTNFIIELSPYFVPVYAILITLVYFVLVSSYNINGATFIFLIGFTLAFHMVSTIEVMKIRQPDIVKSGYFFSVILVYVFNVIVIAAIFGLVFPSFGIKKFFIDSGIVTRNIYAAVIRQLF